MTRRSSRGFGRSVGPRAFGAMGVGGQIAWADPDSGLSFGYLTNGLDVDVVGVVHAVSQDRRSRGTLHGIVRQ